MASQQAPPTADLLRSSEKFKFQEPAYIPTLQSMLPMTPPRALTFKRGSIRNMRRSRYFLEPPRVGSAQPTVAALAQPIENCIYIYIYIKAKSTQTFYPSISTTHCSLFRSKEIIMGFRWVYQQGNYWAPFDDRTNLTIEMLYRNGASKVVHVAHLGSVFVNPLLATMTLNGHQFVIMRTGS